MRQAVQISFEGRCSPWVTVPVAFHILLVRTAVYCHINMYSFLPEGVTVINALWGLAVTLDSEAWASCNRRGSPTLDWSPRHLKDGERSLALDLGELKCFLLDLCPVWLERTDIKAMVNMWRHFRKRHKTGRLLFSNGSQSHTSAPICINKLQASTGKQTLLLEASTTGHHMRLLR